MAASLKPDLFSIASFSGLHKKILSGETETPEVFTLKAERQCQSQNRMKKSNRIPAWHMLCSMGAPEEKEKTTLLRLLHQQSTHGRMAIFCMIWEVTLHGCNSS